MEKKHLDLNALGSLLLCMQRECGYSSKEMSELTGIGLNQYTRYVHAKSRMRLDDFLKICDVLGLEFDRVIYDCCAYTLKQTGGSPG